ncbi:putative ef-hand superfamily ca2+-modulated protein [Botrytis fragariae]|uniref:Calmodulin n=1 Tax=Botrytis fragariae TaxID=1964551 RepID=A0A8H6B507_9HELO|nr:putative ef-hand superfamily ca2+-modulated protein [Botrytis fragariae]KAF5879551.1 putative ef-hand superfamily ca2+-modulated protein [Botrytis fragariae]
MAGNLYQYPDETHDFTLSSNSPAKRKDTSAPAAGPRSKLAKEHNITAAEETEIKEAFSLFSQKMEGEKEGVIAMGDVRRALIALGLTPTPSELREYHSILDPEDEGFTVYRHFVAICAIKFHSRTRTSDSHKKDVDDAFRLFSNAGQKKGGSGGGEDMGKITLATLKRVARVLKEDVDEDLLVSMLLEANGGQGVGKGVERDEFEDVMRRAGMWR